MADVWAEQEAAKRVERVERVKRRAERLALSMSPPPSISNSGKVPFAGYDPTDYWNER